MVLNIYRYLHGVGILDMDPLWATSFVTMYHFLRHFGWGGSCMGLQRHSLKRQIVLDNPASMSTCRHPVQVPAISRARGA